VAASLESAARTRFAELVAREEVPLDEATLAIAQEEYPALRPEAYQARLDALAARVLRRVPSRGRAASTLRALREVLHDEEGLRGNDEDYQDPRNSFLNEVLDRGLGIPISLSVVYMEVARRTGLHLDGVGFPGHFLARYAPPSGPEVYLDAHNGGELLSTEECLARYRARSGGKELDPRFLAAVSSRQVLARMLHNLRRIYAERRDDVRLFWVLDRVLLLVPGQLETLRDRGLAAARLGGTAAAVRDLDAYLSRAPGAADAGEIKAAIAELRGRASMLN
jgi:regulator of sirC expression with transglutaminase-like and TPR domain